MARRMVITGAGGQVGRLLAVQAARNGHDVLALPRAAADITDAVALTGVLRAGDLVVNCAAFTDVDGAESDPRSAEAVNAVAPGVIAATCAAVGAGLVHLSTDYVFSGDFGGRTARPYEVDDRTGPLSVYGAGKLAGERAVLAELPRAAENFYVVRTSWVYTGDGTDFVAVMRRLATGTDRVVDVVDDQIGSPTYAADLVGALLEIAAGGVRGPLLHVANAGTASRYEQARAVFADAGADVDRVRPVGTDAFPRPATRPVYSALSMAGSVAAGLSPLRPWRTALTEALAAAAGTGPIPSSGD